MTVSRRLTDSALLFIYEVNITFGKTTKYGKDIDSDKCWEKATYWKCFLFLNSGSFKITFIINVFFIVVGLVISKVLALSLCTCADRIDTSKYLFD